MARIDHLPKKVSTHPWDTVTMYEDKLVVSDSPIHPANLICELCRLFYGNGWVTGTGGGMTIKQGDLIYIAPSGVQKERLKPENMFVLSLSHNTYLRKPLELKPSACTPLFLSAYNLRGAGACIHTHSQAAVLVTMLYDKTFEIQEQEMIKGVPRGDSRKNGYLGYFDRLVIPIIENTAQEEDLKERLDAAIEAYPETVAVLVRRHGIYVWGNTWEQCKCITECIDYLCSLAVEMKKLGLK